MIILHTIYHKNYKISPVYPEFLSHPYLAKKYQ
uniref:Uncharacterized protein n=1 Tax=Klebsiella phage FKP3 TaxID=3231233 RepID=A0AAU8HZ53_9CAUD